MNEQSGVGESALAADLSRDANTERQKQRIREQDDRDKAGDFQRRAAKLSEKAKRLPLNSNGRKKKEAQARGLLAGAATLLAPQVNAARQQMAEQAPAQPTKPAIFQ